MACRIQRSRANSSCYLRKLHKKFAACGFKKNAFYPLYGLAESTVYVSGEKNSFDAPPYYLCVDREGLEKNKVIISSKNNDSKVLVSSGKPKVQTCIVTDHASGKACDEGEIGEIWLRGSSVTKGYWSKEQETQEVYSASLKSDPHHRYLRTGDLGLF